MGDGFAVIGCDFLECRVVEQAALHEWGPGFDADVVFSAIRDELFLCESWMEFDLVDDGHDGGVFFERF